MAQPIEIYQAGDTNSIEVRVDTEHDTVWLNQSQLAQLFERDQSVLSRHIRNVFKDGELEEGSNMQKMHIANSDKPVAFYSLDVIISVGYRVKSPQGVRFRRWATQRLKDYLIQGYALNQQRFESNAEELQQALALIQKTAQSPELTAEAGSGLVDIVSRYTQTFLWLQQYDEGLLQEPKGQAGGDLPSADDAMTRLGQLKSSNSSHAAKPRLCSPSRAATGWPRCWATWTKAYSGNRPTPPSRAKRRTCCTSW